MKKLFILLTIGLLLASCGIIKNATTSASTNTGLPNESLGVSEIQQSEEQKYAQDPNKGDDFRAWSSYNGFEDDNLEAFAATRARGQMANDISVRIKNAVELYSSKARIADTSLQQETQGVKTGERKDTEDLSSVSKALIRGSRVVMSHRYRQKDGTVTCYVAVELPFNNLMNELQKNKTLQESISRGRIEQIDFNSKEFREAMKAEYEDFEQMQQSH